MTKISDLKFIKEITVWTIRKIDGPSKRLEKWEIWELDFLALTFNSFLDSESKFETEKVAEDFFDSLNMEELKILESKMAKLQDISKKK